MILKLTNTGKHCTIIIDVHYIKHSRIVPWGLKVSEMKTHNYFVIVGLVASLTDDDYQYLAVNIITC